HRLDQDEVVRRRGGRAQPERQRLPDRGREVRLVRARRREPDHRVRPRVRGRDQEEEREGGRCERRGEQLRALNRCALLRHSTLLRLPGLRPDHRSGWAACSPPPRRLLVPQPVTLTLVLTLTWAASLSRTLRPFGAVPTTNATFVYGCLTSARLQVNAFDW